MADHSAPLRQLIEKLLLYRGLRNAKCRVFAPAAGVRSYSVVIEESGVREQFLLELAHVEQFLATGNEQNVLTDIRSALRNLDRQVNKKKAARERR
jgi:hypothetical protein